jgi:hypothetical protein
MSSTMSLNCGNLNLHYQSFIPLQCTTCFHLHFHLYYTYTTHHKVGFFPMLHVFKWKWLGKLSSIFHLHLHFSLGIVWSLHFQDMHAYCSKLQLHNLVYIYFGHIRLCKCKLWCNTFTFMITIIFNQMKIALEWWNMLKLDIKVM